MPNIRKQVWLFLGLVVLSVTLLFIGKSARDRGPINHVEIRSRVIYTLLADTPALREQGLSGLSSLAPNQGMLFIFDAPGVYPFWMKDMNFPIDIIWIDAGKKIVSITRNLSPDTFPQTSAPDAPVKYVLEVNAGLADKQHWQIGDEVKF